MSLTQFETGYWYATEIKTFAREIGIVGISGLRKDELEILIRKFLKTGVISQSRRNLSQANGVKDSALGLTLKLRIRNYTNNKETKEFLVTFARTIQKNFKEKSGARYRLNRWREEQLAQGKPITYGDLVSQFVILCRTKGAFRQAPSGRFVNFLSDYFAGEKNGTRKKALEAWRELKRLKIPKNYRSWKEYTRAGT